jgi:hypothetical protein
MLYLLQNAGAVANDSALIKASLAGSSSSNSLKHSSSLIGTAIQITAGSMSSSGVLDEEVEAQ